MFGTDLATYDKPILVIGNGESRLALNLSNFKNNFITIGCNALHRDYSSDYLVCCDRLAADEAFNNPNIKNTKVLVRSSWHRYFRKIKKHKNAELLPNIPFFKCHRWENPNHWGSGTYALLKGCELGNNIFLIGFDLWGIDNKLNNVYKGTLNYLNKDTPEVDPKFWIKQCRDIFSFNYQKKFVIINSDEWETPKEWLLGNVEIRKFNKIHHLTLNYIPV